MKAHPLSSLKQAGALHDALVRIGKVFVNIRRFGREQDIALCMHSWVAKRFNQACKARWSMHFSDKRTGCVLVGLFMALMVVCTSGAEAQQARESKYITMDFDQVDIHIFIKFISEITGRNFVVDDKVKGKVTVLSPSRINVDEAYKVFESVLEVNGLTAVPAGGVTKIVPSILARQKNIETRIKPFRSSRPDDTFVTQIIPLQHASADDLRKIMMPMVSKEGILIAYAPTETLILTDYFSNIQRLLRIVGELDIALEDARITVIRLKYAEAADAVGQIAKLVQPQKTGGKTPAVVKIVADERLNAVIVLAENKEMAQIVRLLNDLDHPTPKGKNSIHVVHLDNADAEELSKVLTGLAGQQTNKGKEPVISKDVKIVADKATNSLVVTAKPDEFEALQAVLRELDQPRKQVYVEAAIIEVTAGDSLDLGVAWQGGGESGDTVVIGTANTSTVQGNSSGGIPTASINGIATSAAQTFSFGLLSMPFTFNGYQYFSLGAFLQAAQTDSSVNIISTPQLMTLENEEAKVVIAENRPYQTSTNTSDADIDYANYEYKDVGVTLKVTPQINERGSVKMKIYQETSRVDSQATLATGGTLTPITRKRQAETTVEVADGKTVVIAGLIEDSSTNSKTKVPGLGDIPLLGWLFKTDSTSTAKTNMFVFLTPHVVESPEDSRKVFLDKMKLIESVRFNSRGRIEPMNKPLFMAGPLVIR
ncbi:type II secretory protein GspE [Desulfoplanes formicivorans]|uniref:Type II secretory protein GspE n=2 Tax=Desulfoplanes formicivorans TaxID=1592317 RepID=A0A194AFB3_9BACT|nr:type II secretory protein GspE [Desulfoplanes formicivorans]